MGQAGEAVSSSREPLTPVNKHILHFQPLFLGECHLVKAAWTWLGISPASLQDSQFTDVRSYQAECGWRMSSLK